MSQFQTKVMVGITERTRASLLVGRFMLFFKHEDDAIPGKWRRKQFAKDAKCVKLQLQSIPFYNQDIT